MNEPIISPWVFYLMNIADRVGTISFFIASFSFVGLSVTGLSYFIGEFDNIKDSSRKRIIKSSKFLAYCFLVFTPIALFIPGQQTMYKMLITSQVTPNNIEYLKNEVKSTGQGLVDSITDASIKIIKAKESK